MTSNIHTRPLEQPAKDAVVHNALPATPVSLAKEHAVARALAQCIVSALADEECWQQLQSLLHLVLPSCRLAGYVVNAKEATPCRVTYIVGCLPQGTVAGQRGMVFGDPTPRESRHQAHVVAPSNICIE